ncbi:DUF1573 domain-containing protein [Myroides marinus]|jgi:hypothetical protein|uniref:DUF1573 domain-containing protein n=1 Tax=Myroides marinus TaxID=703342 RepID=A0A163VK79_9FLAO|nr:DUF1573 domain-containing protein [Myroides marinus]KUF40232.1 hypothetical protein AS361_16540 [Myroides marinus]KZE75006.1 hypothetical protein AV926_17395 [Myroides marinus]MDM1345932.1 DUF1573 domain-containing protein [Myroides marinus]MDM1350146.1 DUF1573 domain-containing protein [Myroides marinus]MDM1353115.1 DUF1573 domain-containing protein [Myroides marinus]
MKKIILLTLGLALTVVSCKDNSASSKIDKENAAKIEQNNANGEYPSVEFDRVVHDFGNILNNEAVTTEFELTNTGKADLIIINATASCGCTVPDYQKTPIKPGEKSKITVKFQTGAEGQQQKTVTLVTNTEKGEETLTIKANVGLRSN